MLRPRLARMLPVLLPLLLLDSKPAPSQQPVPLPELEVLVERLQAGVNRARLALAFRDTLGLTEAQVASLQPIATSIAAETRDYLGSVRASGPASALATGNADAIREAYRAWADLQAELMVRLAQSEAALQRILDQHQARMLGEIRVREAHAALAAMTDALRPREP